MKVSIGVVGGMLFVLLLGAACSQGFSPRGPEDSPVPGPGVTATPVRPQSETTTPTPGAAPKGPEVRPPALPVTPTPSSQSTAQVELVPQGQAVRKSVANAVTIEATLEGKWLTGSKELVFNIVLDTHSVDLDVYDLSTLTVLRDNQGREFKPVSWKAPKGGHHRDGVLAFSAGQPILTPDTTLVELSIKDIAGALHLLRWDLRPAAS